MGKNSDGRKGKARENRYYLLSITGDSIKYLVHEVKTQSRCFYSQSESATGGKMNLSIDGIDMDPLISANFLVLYAVNVYLLVVIAFTNCKIR